MRHFNTRFRLLDTDRNIRLVYTLFIATLFAGFLFTVYWAHSVTGLSYSGIAQHYLGSDQTFGEPKSFRELPRTHFPFLHASGLPDLCHVLSHGFANLRRSSRGCLFWGWHRPSPWLSFISRISAAAMLIAHLIANFFNAVFRFMKCVLKAA